MKFISEEKIVLNLLLYIANYEVQAMLKLLHHAWQNNDFHNSGALTRVTILFNLDVFALLVSY